MHRAMLHVTFRKESVAEGRPEEHSHWPVGLRERIFVPGGLDSDRCNRQLLSKLYMIRPTCYTLQLQTEAVYIALSRLHSSRRPEIRGISVSSSCNVRRTSLLFLKVEDSQPWSI